MPNLTPDEVQTINHAPLDGMVVISGNVLRVKSDLRFIAVSKGKVGYVLDPS